MGRTAQLLFLIGVFVAPWAGPRPVAAQAGDAEAAPPTEEPAGEGASEQNGSLLPEPEGRPPKLAGEAHVSVIAPIADDPLCPKGALCIFGAGGGVGGRVERRWPTGYALSFVYEVWFLDSNGVWEISTLQQIGAGLRYFFMRDNVWHPYIGVQGGLAIFGDSFKAAGVGGGAEPFVGVEWELTQTLALTFAAAGRVFLTSAFTTPNDGVRRASRQGVDAALSFRLGLAIMEAP